MKRKTVKILIVLFAVLLGVAGFFAAQRVLNQADLYQELTVEIGSPLPGAADFLVPGQSCEAEYVSATSGINMHTLGIHSLVIRCNGSDYSVTLKVVDTAAPTAVTRDLTALQWQLPEAKDFIVSVADATQVTVSYAQEPDSTDPQPQTVSLLLTDEAGNTATVTAKLTVTIDTTPPVITGVQDLTVEQGGTVSYRTGVSVTDDLDPAVQLMIDASAVNPAVPGKYAVVYSATDRSGNTSSVTAYVLVKTKEYQVPDIGPDEGMDDVLPPVPEETVVALVNKYLSQIITGDMGAKEKIQAIYTWVRDHVGYSGRGLGQDFTHAAYLAIAMGEGDCRNFFALTRMMLDQAGIPNIDVMKVPNSPTDSNHYWHLVSLDGGATYYHLDTVPRIPEGNFFLVTDAQLDAYSVAHRNCFNRDTSLYPATPKEPLQ